MATAPLPDGDVSSHTGTASWAAKYRGVCLASIMQECLFLTK